MKTAIAICGSSGIDYVNPSHGFYTFRSILIVNNKEYVDYEDMDANTLYKKMVEPNTQVHTAQTPTGTLVTLLEKIKKDGFDEVLLISISSGLSGTVNGIHTAASMVEGIKVYAFDSLFIGYPIIKMAYYAKNQLVLGVSVPDIMKQLEKIRESLKVYFIVDNVQFLVNNGRLTVAKGILAKLFNIKPVLTNDPNKGTLHLYKTIRAKRKAKNVMIEDVLNDTSNKDNIELFILYSDDLEEAEEFKKEIMSKINRFKDIPIYMIPPVIGLHVGPGTLALGYIIDKV